MIPHGRRLSFPTGFCCPTPQTPDLFARRIRRPRETCKNVLAGELMGACALLWKGAKACFRIESGATSGLEFFR